ncbi:hypothetical protein [Brevibacillus daliensis]|uniref:hypothetical protein n=1 Tax=Brevibacillus daliensis TaxID=2892995 RepID=UPI001E2AF281|nr:hypothetical protein [Brevibacillus daliensis]
MRNLIDTIFGPVDRFISSALESLSKFAIERNRPIELDTFFAPFTVLGDNWVFLIKAVVLSLMTVTGLLVAVLIRNLYLYFKEGVKWW